MSMFNRNALLALFAAVAISACSSTPEDTTAEPADAGTTTQAPDQDVSGGTMDDTYGAAQEPTNPALENRVVYFDFDKANIRPDAIATLQAHAQYLSQNPGARVRVEGHADERGTREYNMALGERRAKAAASFLAANGASASQLEIISYGEERPVALGHDESSWSQNRRSELNYTAEAP
ncbi:MAG: peptidoglycan-associated lipoprotein [Pseudomonadales bacterium]|jgi:peptidoglycan-associated lipoprotein|uniref:peptidoglycan-associated lipoprotein Pal n=1 Tax=unclassified Ketobacter TaxID=2639109 RepID=UPI000C8C6F9A|nr:MULTISPECIES: peptidoglycan-associated lipoprotein Pal [unclassified Ketobacter]MAQ26300.1 peptidoglycan-associated lipoprotein [Pseudomonadales bacterium]MEC8813165.1 peptidoglycan-associated lipoprotein Pal [Pseudomonadota bacterium]HAG97163.1 peptidoglycan-associated lipoprotein Pal [Gammaproteobacteria bacterium]MCK5791653.1 peptidoglycan-associated lipoprotein Pal [Ketobacter sp.]RLT89883.1 MAG: peptidoglycan-associated lipoprotein Pal [Ketobacter sp. GenoA1]